ncbi:MAG TPA: murein biosynthesis integral membrane protein MurJ [Acidobacteriaceae bacterium]|nr:murein biosynthesis integral membrane protein MurJ [Acidobacteriaceae bacterium]
MNKQEQNKPEGSVERTQRMGGRSLQWLRPSHEHTAFSATILLMLSAFLSRIIGLVRIKVIAYFFGAGSLTDAYNAAFQLPDMISYLLVGGVASITFITILSRYREQGKEAEGEQAMSVILSTMLLVLGVAVLLGELFAPMYTRAFFPGFNAEKAALCTHMTRILLPGQLFFFAGGVLAAVLLVRKQFAYQAVSPLIYSLGIILGAVLLARYFSVSSLAIGALAGAFAGPFLLNAIGTRRAGLRFRFQLNWSHPGLREWVRLSIPLMLGVSLVSADTWILNHFASHGLGDIARLSYAKQLFTAPMAILGQAAGAASLPFFAALIGKGRMQDFAASVNRSVTRIFAFAFLLSAWMIGLAYPVVDFVLRGGSFHHADATKTALYFSLFAGSLCMWCAQAIYARAFYAAGNTLTPMVASTLITAASIPLYWFLFHHMGVVGLALASDIGIVVQTLALALLLDWCKLVRIRGMEFSELGRALLAAIAGGSELFLLARLLPSAGTIPRDMLQLACGTVAWFLTCWVILYATGSTLPQQLITRLRSRNGATPPVAVSYASENDQSAS